MPEPPFSVALGSVACVHGLPCREHHDRMSGCDRLLGRSRGTSKLLVQVQANVIEKQSNYGRAAITERGAIYTPWAPRGYFP